ncbi:dynamin family protein [Cryptosporangium phraense]|uniref:dynamin family protein n=1 Tax=Cryptosporangium phraense TaxID=2593070 RepID=UPI00197A939E|nr:dynamin family protein [Cryptosporangium phraense]
MTAPSTVAPDPDPAAIALLPAAVRAAYDAADRTGQRIRLGTVPEFTLVLVGPVDSGKTVLAARILADVAATFPGLAPRPGRGIGVPVEWVYGPVPTLWLAVGDAWEQVPCDFADFGSRADLRRVRVAAPARVLDSWGLGIVDTPGLVDGSDPSLDEARREGVGVLYVLPRRGVTELDVQALEALRHVPSVLVENRRASEAAGGPAGIGEVAAPGVVVPLVTSRLGAPGPELDLLRRCVAALRAHTLPERWASTLSAAAARSRETVGAEYARRRTMAVMARHPDWIGSLHVLADLLAVERDGPAVIDLDDRLAQVARLASEVGSAPALRAAVEQDAAALAEAYDAQADVVEPPPEVDTGGVPFGSHYSRTRDDLVALLDNALADAGLGATGAEREALAGIRGGVLVERPEVVVLGPASAGKSALINALIGAPVLPVAAHASTSAVTRLRHASTPSVGVTWRDDVTLRLLSPGAEPHQVRVHVENVRAIERWLRDRAVAARDAEFRPLTPTPAGIDGPAALARLWAMLDFSGSPHRHAYLAPSPDRPRIIDPSVPAEVTVRAFASTPDRWPGPAGRDRALEELARDPSLAVRIGTLELGEPCPLLEHVTIVDTPGTDAPLVHHRADVQRAVRDGRPSVVVYCIDGTKPASREDEANLAFLRNSRTDARVYVVLTKKGLVGSHADRIREAVARGLTAPGAARPPIYFTEVVADRNDEFRAFADDLRRAVLSAQQAALAAWIDRAHAVVSEVAERHGRRVERVAEGERGRAARADGLRADVSTLAEVRAALRTAAWGEPGLRDRVDAVVADAVRPVDEVVFGERRGTPAARERLAARLEDLNHRAGMVLAEACAAVGRELSVRIPRGTLRVPEPVPDGTPFAVAVPVLAPAESPGGWRALVDPRRWRSAPDEAWLLVGTEWPAARERGRRAVAATVEEFLGRLDAELGRLADELGAEVAAAGDRAVPHEGAIAGEGRDRASLWLKRLDAVGRTCSGGDS